MNRLIPALAAALATAGLALSAGVASAQMPQHREGMRATMEACKDKPDRRACMAEQMCAKAQDPAKCQAHVKARGEHMQQRIEARQKMHEACNGKRGEDLGKCLDSQRLAMRSQRQEERQKAHEACNGKRGDELMGCLRSQREKMGP